MSEFQRVYVSCCVQVLNSLTPSATHNHLDPSEGIKGPEYLCRNVYLKSSMILPLPLEPGPLVETIFGKGPHFVGPISLYNSPLLFNVYISYFYMSYLHLKKLYNDRNVVKMTTYAK